MRSKNACAALLVAIGASAGLALAVPVHADPADDQRAEQQDQAFLKALRDEGLRMTSSSDAIDLAHSTCAVLGRGGTTDDALRHIKNSTDWTDFAKIGKFGGVAVQSYCPGPVPK